jgi:tetratricopeptide (TPR) repeat protein
LKFCFTCGHELTLGREKFCPNCGENFESSSGIEKVNDGRDSIYVDDIDGDVIGIGVKGTGNFIGKEIRYTVRGNVINLHVNEISTQVMDTLKKTMLSETQLPMITDSKDENKKDGVNLTHITQTQETITNVLNDVKKIEKKEGMEIQKIEVGDLKILTKDLLIKNALAKATVLYYTHQYQDALVWYDKLIALDDTKPDVWYNKGVINGKLEQNKTAINCFDKAIALRPDYAHAWYNKGVCLGRLGKHKQAIQCFKKVRAISMLVQ